MLLIVWTMAMVVELHAGKKAFEDCKNKILDQAAHTIELEKNKILERSAPENNPFINQELSDRWYVDYERAIVSAINKIPLLDLDSGMFKSIEPLLPKVRSILHEFGIFNCHIKITSDPTHEAMTCYTKDFHYLILHPHCFLHWPPEIYYETIVHEIVHMMRKDSLIKYYCMRCVNNEYMNRALNAQEDMIKILIEGQGVESFLKAQEEYANIYAIVKNPLYKEAGNPPFYNHIRDELAAAEIL